MRIATWNVNSVRARTGRIVDWLERADIDVLAMQETKCKVDQFPVGAFEEAGYEVEVHGTNQWNGVAFASRLPMSEPRVGFANMPGYANTPPESGELPLEARALGVTVEDVRLWSLYVPNGRELGHPHYAYKLAWLRALLDDTVAWLGEHPDEPLALMGDFNIAPLDTDVWDMAAFDGLTHVSPPERDAFQALLDGGLVDVVRDRGEEGFTYWDYKAGRFQRNHGMRIDFILGSAAFDELVVDASIERDERGGDAPSDHVPVVVELDIETSMDDDRPMIF
ncbi:putative exodeoxyribonuclease III protein XthA [Pseudoclavibacter endophyticus]|uniref:Exodeoxyribonuclease III n=1 Tax=Pseudoclavibacter endophyticus TaxID=1778590 RepID=A0A6H9WMK5_9MICO|nr:exodeoxyribonuclease III [Pseudoclavibacter endophyticus]KAB1649031.1 exodeoxyribonuclease III [Pseudoclavibacter endophyticus]GGA66064.1 putative exodeoxyribonuclease III protein XthA [Pseudoclavibacter endophyticus]